MLPSTEEIKNMTPKAVAEMYNGEIKHLHEQIDLLTEALCAERNNRFGRSSEKDLSEEENGQQSLFNEAEALADVSLKEPAIEEVVITYTRKKENGKRKEDLSRYEHEVIPHELTEEQLREEFPKGWNRLNDEVYELLVCHPAKYTVEEHHVSIYKGKNGKIVRAPHPRRLLRASIVTPSLGAAIINAKYTNAMPLYRIEQEFERNEISISRQTMANWMIRLSEDYLSVVCDRMWQHLKTVPVLQADETTVEVSKDGRSAGSKSYMWVYRTGITYPEKQIILYDYRKTRNAEHPAECLKGYSGILVTDGYQAYHKLDEETDSITVAGCWAHARRRFADAVKAAGSSKKTLASDALKRIQKIYDAEKKLEGLPFERKAAERQKKIKPLADAFFLWVKQNRNRVLPSSKTGEGFTYCLNQEKYLRVFLERGDVPIDNNASERDIRPFTVGRKNWVMIDTIAGARASASLYSLVETAKASNLKVFEYLEFLLTKLPDYVSENRKLEELDEPMPWSEKIPDSCKKKPR